MLRQSLAFAFGLVLLAGMSGQADAAKKKSTHVVLRGCTHFQVPFCTMINSGGKNYSLVWTTPPVPPIPLHTHMTVVGEVTGTVGTCFAPVVRVTSWKADARLCVK